jgi:hypothetical protein
LAEDKLLRNKNMKKTNKETLLNLKSRCIEINEKISGINYVKMEIRTKIIENKNRNSHICII